jgi:hypothetical protein
VLQLDPDDDDAADRIVRLGRRDGSAPRVPAAGRAGQRDDPGHVAGFRDVELVRQGADEAGEGDDAGHAPAAPGTLGAPDAPDAADAPDAPDETESPEAPATAAEPAAVGATADADRTEPPGRTGPSDALQGLATKTLADIYIAQGYREKARSVLRRILEQQPGRDDVKARLAELDALPSPDLAPPLDTDAGASFSPADTVIPRRRPSEDHVEDRKQFAEWLRRLKQQQKDD